MKKFISVLLSLLMVFSLCSSVSADDGKVAKIGDNEYSTLQEAINDESNGDTITLIANTNEDVVIEYGKNITINIADGVTLTNVNDHTIINNGNLTITGKGTIDNITHGKGDVVNNYGATLVLKDGITLTRSKEAGSSPTSNGGNSWYNISNQGNMDIYDAVSVISTGSFSSLIRNGEGKENEEAILKIHNGKFSGGINTIKNGDFGKLYIEDGEFLNSTQATLLNWNYAEINGGTYKPTNNATDAVITGLWKDGNYDTEGKTIITGGDFYGSISLYDEKLYPGKGFNGDTTISGGTFSSGVTEYLKDGYTQNTDGKVVEKTYVASIGDKKYETLQKAIDASKDGDTVNVLTNLSLDKGLTLNKDITIDLGGNTIESKGMMFDIYSKVTLKNGIFKGVEFTKAGATIWLNKNASLLVEKDATIDVASNGTSSFDISFWTDCDGASLNVKGTLKGENGVTVNGSILTNNTVNIDGATIDVTGHGLYLAGTATTNISNTKINAGSTAIEIRAGELNIKDGTYTSAGEFKTSPNGNGTTVDGAAIAISQHTTKLPIDVTIDGGSFKGEYSLYEANVQENDEESLAKINIKINDGNFDGKFFIENNAEKSIKGGKYSVDVSKYLISGYNVAKISETYSVVKDGEKISVTSPTSVVDEKTFEEVKKVEANSVGITLNVDPNITLSSSEKEKIDNLTSKDSKIEKLLPLDIKLYSYDVSGNEKLITDLNSPITVTIYLPDDVMNSIKDAKSVKVARFHDGELTLLDATLNGNVLTFKTDKFSTYAIVAYGVAAPSPTPTPTPSVTPSVGTTSVVDKKAGPKDLNSDGIITCDEEMGSKNWIWSETKGACVYKVSNTSTK